MRDVLANHSSGIFLIDANGYRKFSVTMWYVLKKLYFNKGGVIHSFN